MATLDTFRPTLPASHGSVLSNLLGRIVAWNDRRVTVKMLNQLTDAELSDIGLTRESIDAYARARR